MTFPIPLLLPLLVGDQLPPVDLKPEDQCVEVRYLEDKASVLAVVMETARIRSWRQYTSCIPRFLVISEEHCELPLVVAANRTESDTPRAAFDVRPAMDPAFTDGEAQAAENFSAAAGNPPPQNMLRPMIWCVASPGIEIDTSGAYIPTPSPKIGLIRVQDPARVPAPKEGVDVGAFMRQTLWVLVSGYRGYEVLTNPSPLDLRKSDIIQTIEARERPNGIDFFVVLGAHTRSFGFQAAVTVDAKSGEDRFWYGVEHLGGGEIMRLRVVTTGKVTVSLTPVRDAATPNTNWESWPKFWGDYAASLYTQTASLVSGPGELDGLSQWFEDLWALIGTPSETGFNAVLKLLSDLNNAIGSVLQQDQVDMLSRPFFYLERIGADGVWKLPPPAMQAIRALDTSSAHPLHRLTGDLSWRYYDSPSASGTVLAGVTGMPLETAETITAIGTGYIPLVGDALDILDVGSTIATGQMAEGTDANWLDWAGVGLFAIVAGTGIYHSLRTDLRARYRGAE